jgi:hypothetical protein
MDVLGVADVKFTAGSCDLNAKIFIFLKSPSRDND